MNDTIKKQSRRPLGPKPGPLKLAVRAALPTLQGWFRAAAMADLMQEKFPEQGASLRGRVHAVVSQLAAAGEIQRHEDDGQVYYAATAQPNLPADVLATEEESCQISQATKDYEALKLELFGDLKTPTKETP